MLLKELTKFKRWANRESRRRGLICHFYIVESRKQFYSKTDYAYFNLFCSSRDWLIKGTPKHGITSQRGPSPVPCLNCFEINDKFYKALEKLHEEGNEKFELGIILNKRKIKNYFEVIDVSTKPPSSLPPPSKCHHYDYPRQRIRALWPFHRCDVVRIEIPKSDLRKIPIVSIPYQTIMGMLIKREDHHAITELLKVKKSSINVFPLL